MERTVVLLGDPHRQKIAQLACAMHCSAAEIHRRAIEYYDPAGYDNDDLKKAVALLHESHQHAVKALKHAEAEVAKTMAFYLKTQDKKT